MLDVYDYAAGAQVVSCTKTDNDGKTTDCQLYDKSLLGSCYEYGMYLGDDAPFVRICTSVNNDRRLLLIKDEYADCFVQFLIQHYSEIAIVSPQHMTRSLSSFVNVGDYEQTLFLFGIENLGTDGLLDMITE